MKRSHDIKFRVTVGYEWGPRSVPEKVTIIADIILSHGRYILEYRVAVRLTLPGRSPPPLACTVQAWQSCKSHDSSIYNYQGSQLYSHLFTFPVIKRNMRLRLIYVPMTRFGFSPATPACYRGFSARVVLTHSTHCAQLISALSRLSSVGGIRSIVPGRLATARCNVERLEVRVSVPLHNGHKLIARKGTQVQEVFVVTHLSASDLKREVDRVLAD